ncbi:MAG: HAD-IC family P-type ATPase [Bacilli bacterium]|nr:HAD-IC family P-type ATPase [Bacilli bacterium]
MKKEIVGLTTEQVVELTGRGLVNYETEVRTKSIGQIIMTNFLTLFNMLNLGLALAIFLVGSYKNLLFLGVVICNTLISTVQEIRSKLTIDKLSLLNAMHATVIRDGKEKSIDIHKIVLGDVIKLGPGDQVVTDCKILSGEALVNEALITGESEPETKCVGDELLSGSFIVSGHIICETIRVGEENYTSKISAEAKYIKKVNSEIMNFINKIIKYISIAIVPIGILLFIHQLGLDGNTFDKAVVNVVAALIGMIPEGLVLLTSTVLAISVMRLSKYNVLVQEIYCIETLARVDTICLDKTGTLTKGEMDVTKIVPLNLTNMSDITDALGLMSYHMETDNQTMEAISRKYSRKNDYKVLEIVPFSSQAKWSGISFEKESYILGAPEIVLPDDISIKKEVSIYSGESRVVLLAKSKHKLNKKLPMHIEPMALILINDKIRPDARATLEYFKAQNVDIKLISGDNPVTVAGVASKVGLENIKYVDMSSTKMPIKDLVLEYNVFGRVKPDQKKKIILELKSQGHTVAMTGDGVNDVLALKEADCSIAMNSGSDAARNVAQLVLLDSNFASMPKVVAEGRRSINNLQRSSSLFLCKTVYATLLAIIFLFLNKSYPFIPIQLTLTSTVTIGIPSFVLALEPNNERINGRIIVNVLRKSLPTALTIVTNIIIITILPEIVRLSSVEVSTLAVILTAATGFMLLYRISVPFNTLRRVLFASLVGIFVVGVVFFKDLFSLTMLNLRLAVLTLILILIAMMAFNMYCNICNKLTNKIKFK